VVAAAKVTNSHLLAVAAECFAGAGAQLCLCVPGDNLLLYTVHSFQQCRKALTCPAVFLLVFALQLNLDVLKSATLLSWLKDAGFYAMKNITVDVRPHNTCFLALSAQLCL
jgi:hypothetical protein